MAKLTKEMIAKLIVDESEVPSARRGRTMNVNENLRDVLGALTPGKAVRLDSILGVENDRTKQQAISQKIRQHWKLVHADFNPSIGWVDGKPSVKFGKAIEVPAN